MSKTTIMIVEDNLLVSSAVQDILNDEGYEAMVFENGKEATTALKKSPPNLILLDMMLPDGNGKDFMIKWRKDEPNLPIVFMTAHGDVQTAVDALKAGADDFLVKPVEKPLLLKTIENAIKRSTMAKQVTVLTELTKRETDYTKMGDVIAESPVMKKTLAMAQTVAQSDFSCLLVTGESGTGKGLLARTIHNMGMRANKPFVEVNCSALPANLIESELFGHKKGAFTDAKEDKVGLFEMADGGTLFLDEIGDMDFNLQAKLLKVIEEQKFRRIGATNDITVNVAIIAATNQDVENLVKNDRFRTDLYYRLNVIPIHIPPLKERMEDITALAEHFVKFFARKFGKAIQGFGDDATRALNCYSWPGNIREFRNVVERSCILTQDAVINDPNILFPMGMGAGANGGAGVSQTPVSFNVSEQEFPAMPLRQAEELVIKAAMREADGNKNKAAKTLGLHRTTLYKKLEEYGIE